MPEATVDLVVSGIIKPHFSPKCNTSGGGDRFCCRMMLRIGQEAATVPATTHRRLPCPRATAT